MKKGYVLIKGAAYKCIILNSKDEKSDCSVCDFAKTCKNKPLKNCTAYQRSDIY